MHQFVADQEPTNLTRQERDLVKRIADRDGVTLDEAATRLAKEGLARRVKRRTGKTPARVYPMKK
jgi:predicted kinase